MQSYIPQIEHRALNYRGEQKTMIDKTGDLRGENVVLPLVTIITVTFNSGSGLRQALDSVVNQSYEKIEFIVIDGGSTDGTIDLIKEYSDKIAYWVSEPDQGIYNAMNKGIDKANGDLVYFLNSDDYFYDNKVVEDIVKIYSQANKPDVIYGDVMNYNKKQGIIGRSGREIELKDVQKGRVICHQGIFMKRDLLIEHKFNEQYKIVADYELQVKCLIQRCHFLYVDRVIAYYYTDGFSSQLESKRRIIFEKMDVIKKHSSPGVFWRYYFSSQIKLLRISAQIVYRNATTGS
jgi:glycosyltransferase involved in cell wall biosynthesis